MTEVVIDEITVYTNKDCFVHLPPPRERGMTRARFAMNISAKVTIVRTKMQQNPTSRENVIHWIPQNRPRTETETP